jgi:hypothetical protein
LKNNDVDKDRFTAAPLLPEMRDGGGLALVDRRLHYMGGVKADRDTDAADQWVLDLEMWAQGSAQWENAAPLPAPQTEAELAALRRSVHRGCPFGESAWCDRMVRRLGLESTLRPQGRPKKDQKRFLTVLFAPPDHVLLRRFDKGHSLPVMIPVTRAKLRFGILCTHSIGSMTSLSCARSVAGTCSTWSFAVPKSAKLFLAGWLTLISVAK